MPSRLRQIAGRVGNFVSQNKGKLAIGLGAVTALGAGAYALSKYRKSNILAKSKRRQTLSKIRTKRRIWQEKVKLERAKKNYERVMSA